LAVWCWLLLSILGCLLCWSCQQAQWWHLVRHHCPCLYVLCFCSPLTFRFAFFLIMLWFCIFL
jgi:hypothetical protein